MAAPIPKDWTYNYETLSRLSGWDVEKIRTDAHRGTRLDHIEDAVLWLAENGSPDIRAAIARRVLPVVLGTDRYPNFNAEIENLIRAPDLLLQIFRRDAQWRQERAKRLSQGRKRALRKVKKPS